VARKRGMALYVRTKAACTAIEVSVFNPRLNRSYNECDEWRAKVLDEIMRVKPEIVLIAHSSRHSPMASDKVQRLFGSSRLAALAEGERSTIRRIASTGAKVVMIADTPWLPVDPIECLLQNQRKTEACRWPEQEVFQSASPWSFNHEDPPPGVAIIDMSDAPCWGGFCYAANKEHLIMRDRHHLAPAFATSLAGKFDRRLKKALANSSVSQSAFHQTR
jgi:hypothetical protein